MDDRSATTFIEALASSLEAASRHNPGDVEKPAAIVWTDHDSQWQPIIPQLRQLVPQLLTLGEYQPEQRTGPAIWLRCVVDHTLEEPEFPEGTIPILYLPDVSRQALRAVQECPDSLKPLVELQYRGVCWTQKNGKDWTVKAFLVAENGGLGLDIAQDAATQRSMLGALAELATTSLERLRGKHLEAEDFDKLFSDDPTKDILLWLSAPKTVQANWTSERWSAFTSRCKAELTFKPGPGRRDCRGGDAREARRTVAAGVGAFLPSRPHSTPAYPSFCARQCRANCLWNLPLGPKIMKKRKQLYAKSSWRWRICRLRQHAIKYSDWKRRTA